MSLCTVPSLQLFPGRHRLLIDVITTVPFDAIVLAALRLPEGEASRYVALLGLLKLGRMYRVGVMFRNMSFNLNLGLLTLTLLRNFTVSCPVGSAHLLSIIGSKSAWLLTLLRNFTMSIALHSVHSIYHHDIVPVLMDMRCATVC
jgi:hypothetical protein